MILIHKARGCQCGISSDMRSYAEMLDKVDDTMANVYSEQTGNTKAEMLEQMSVNNGDGEWLTADEAQEIGLIKDIIEPMRAAANYDLTRLKEFGYKIPQNKLNIIKMKFGKKEAAINALAMQDGSILLYEGELKEGSELQKAGETVDLKGEHELADGRKIVIDDKNKVTSIEEKPAAKAKEEKEDEIVAQVAQILVDFETKIDAKIEELKKTGG